MTTIVGLALKKTSRLHKLNVGRHDNGLKGPPPVMDAFKTATHILCPSLPELEFPMRVRPTTIGCGPIVLPACPVSKIDPELDAWLHRSSMDTILVNLGTHYSMDLGLALEVASALKAVLDEYQDVQILWKIMLKGQENQDDLDRAFGIDLLDSGRIRMKSWLKPDPVALLETGRVVAQVHHGGANTYFECCR